MRHPHPVLPALALAAAVSVAAEPAPARLPAVTDVEIQPLVAQCRRLEEALDALGSPLPAADRGALKQAYGDADAARAVLRIQEILDPHCIATVRLAGGEDDASPVALTPHPWSYIGPFDGRDLAAVHPPEQAVDLKASCAGRDGGRVSWQDGSRFADGQVVDLGGVFQSADHTICYLHRIIEASRDGPAWILFGSDDWGAVWVNGEKVHDYRGYRPTRVDEDQIRITLKKGENRVLVKVGNRQLGYGFAFRVVPQLPDDVVRETSAAPGAPELVQQGWRTFLVKVRNEAGVTAGLVARSPQGGAVYNSVGPAEVAGRWLDLDVAVRRPLNPGLSGLALEYRPIQIFSRDAGPRDARIAFGVGGGPAASVYGGEVAFRFHCRPAVAVTLRVRDEKGAPATAAFEFRDPKGRVYPSPSKRLAPDFFFHAQVYRADGETIDLPPGEYDVVCSRGPEYLVQRRTMAVPAGAAGHEESFALARWVDPAATGWISGDHHIHAAGCAHYEKPTEGVFPKDMMRHCMGEDLKVGCVLTWGPCYYFQKQFFSGGVDGLSRPPYLMRYDLEVSGFPSSHAGHLVLLNLRDQDYPGTKKIEDWPSWDLPILRWAKAQGAVTGFAHSAAGLAVDSHEVPNFLIPPFDGIGANEYIMDVVHEVPGPDGRPVPAVDFISTVNTNPVYELNIWYHTLNAGCRARVSGETDFPCVYGARVGMGRVYARVPGGAADYETWVRSVRDGRSYVSDGTSHLMDFAVNGVGVGEGASEVRLAAPGRVTARARVAARLDEAPNDAVRWTQWNLEKARIAGTREVPVELVVNGRPVARKNVVADGAAREVAFEAAVDTSAWVALRIYPSSHTNPVFVVVGDKPVRVKESIEWCLKSVDRCWSQKERGTRAGAERDEARNAYDRARDEYRRRLQECE